MDLVRTTPALRAALLPIPQVRQRAGHPPRLAFLVPAPGLAVADDALGHGVAVDHADLDVAHGGAGLEVGAGAGIAVRGDLHLLVAFQLQRRHFELLAHLGIDQVHRAFEIAPADRTRPRVLRLVELVALGPKGGAGRKGEQAQDEGRLAEGSEQTRHAGFPRVDARILARRELVQRRGSPTRRSAGGKLAAFAFGNHFSIATYRAVKSVATPPSGSSVRATKPIRARPRLRRVAMNSSGSDSAAGSALTSRSANSGAR